MNIDRKFKIIATSENSNKVYTEEDGVFFKAADPAFLMILKQYPEACRIIGTDDNQIECTKSLIERVEAYQKNFTKIPDVTESEVPRLLAPNI